MESEAVFDSLGPYLDESRRIREEMRDALKEFAEKEFSWEDVVRNWEQDLRGFNPTGIRNEGGTINVEGEPIKEMMAKHVAFVERLLTLLPDDLILCVHESEFQVSPSTFDVGGQKFIARTVSHTIEKPDDCKARIMRRQYGPKR